MSLHYLSDIEDVLSILTQCERRVLLVGDSGAGKSTLAAQLLDDLNQAGLAATCLSCDPGLPAFGVPGTLGLARRQNQRWLQLAMAPLCSLDAGRFRLPLVSATNRLLAEAPAGCVIIDTPGMTEGAAAAELMQALIHMADVDLCLVLTPPTATLPLANELSGCGADIIRLACSAQARPLARKQRLNARSQRWHDHLDAAQQLQLPLDGLALLGTPPPLNQQEAWRGRQVALLHKNQLLTLGEVQQLAEQDIQLRVAQLPEQKVDQLLLRDAEHRDGVLRTVRKPPARVIAPLPHTNGASEVKVELGALTSISSEPQVAVRVGNITATLVNGVMGDPLLQVRLLHQGRSLLFDIGDTGRMPLRAAHQITDLFVSHTHADHIGGFMWLVRCRIGNFPPCRVFGPAGLAEQVRGMVSGILWDRVEDRAPRFDIYEWHGDQLQCWRLVAGSEPMQRLPDIAIEDDVLMRDPSFVVRAVELDHGTPVLAYAFESRCRLNVRKERLDALQLQPGPWLQELKYAYLRSQLRQIIALPGDRSATVAELAEQLLLEQPGDKIVYATDFSDSERNIASLTRLARGAHTLFCEASFMRADRDQAQRTQHLTTEACARIAQLAGVRQLLAFHFSHRYQGRKQQVYRELQELTSRVVIPG